MECKKCKYLYEDRGWSTVNVCRITNRVNPISCNITSDEEIENMEICFNCEYWHGGGDWGLSCAKNYYDCSTDGFREACHKFERKE